ncbi:MAG: LTA synthase family protein [Magnetococcales bacterium]|nr:LTA synthase family protein [Magnetococcales bacterium]
MSGFGARERFWGLTLAGMVMLWGLTRLMLIGWVGFAGPSVSIGESLLALLSGLPLDLAVAVVFSSPFLLALLGGRWLWRRRLGRWLGHGIMILTWSALLFNIVATLFFWNEFDSLFNGIAVNYLIFPREVIGNLQESFNLFLWLPFFVLGGWVGWWLTRSLARAALASAGLPQQSNRRLWGLLLGAWLLAGPVLYLWPFEVSSDRRLNQIAGNSLHSLFYAFLTNDTEYDGLYLTMDEGEAAAVTRSRVAQAHTRWIDRPGPATLWRHMSYEGPLKKLHIVLVIEESFGSAYLDGLDNQRPWPISPDLARLASQGALFTNIHATGDRTVRGLEALLTSFAPIPGVSTARRAGSRGMNSLPLLLHQLGYRSAFLYGGRAVFDNMGTFWRSIGFDAVWDQGDIAQPGFTTVWGVADEFLFTEALQRLDEGARSDQPFFLGLLTVSNHRPYRFPEDHVSWDNRKTNRENAASYAAWAFADFVERARSHAWFDDTVFVFIGDHGPRVIGAAQVPIEGFRVPLIFYSPKHITPQRHDVIGSSMDVAPTLLGLLNVSHDTPFFGVDLRRVATGEGRFVMAHNYSIAYGRNGLVTVLDPAKRIRGYRLPTGQPGWAPLVATPTADAEVTREAVALTQLAHRLFYARRYHELGAVDETGLR